MGGVDSSWLMARVEIRGLHKEFEGTVAVENLDLEVKDKEFVVLLGPSGCGKTTTLRCIAGLESPSEGEIYIGDRLVNDLEPKERNVAMVFQSYALYPHMTVFQNLAFPLENARVSERDIVNRVNRTARLLQIDGFLGRKPAQLSGGQRQRVAVGRAIVREPEVFLMDEPLSNLDAQLRVYMRAELKKLQKDIGVTTIYVTHDQVEAMTMADRVALLHKGTLQQYAHESVRGWLRGQPAYQPHRVQLHRWKHDRRGRLPTGPPGTPRGALSEFVRARNRPRGSAAGRPSGVAAGLGRRRHCCSLPSDLRPGGNLCDGTARGLHDPRLEGRRQITQGCGGGLVRGRCRREDWSPVSL